MKVIKIKNRRLNESNTNETFYIAVYFLNRDNNVIAYDDTRVWYIGTIEDARKAIYDTTAGVYTKLTDKILNAYYALSDIQAGMVNACQLILCDEDHKPIDKSVFLSWKKLAIATTESYNGRNRNGRKINEGRVSVRGTRKETDVYPVPYDDDYVERYGPTKPREEHKSENQFIEKYADAIAQRLEYAFKQQGVKTSIEFSEDIKNTYYHEKREEFDCRQLIFYINITSLRNRRYGATKVLQCATVASKMFSQLSVVNSYDIKVECDDFGHEANITINAYVKPDKNGMLQLEKEPRWNPFDDNLKYTARSRYQDEDEEYDY